MQIACTTLRVFTLLGCKLPPQLPEAPWRPILSLSTAAGVVTGSGQTYVVVQEGDNISFVPAEMVQGDLGAAVNGGQVSPRFAPRGPQSQLRCRQFLDVYLSHNIWTCV